MSRERCRFMYRSSLQSFGLPYRMTEPDFEMSGVTWLAIGEYYSSFVGEQVQLQYRAHSLSEVSQVHRLVGVLESTTGKPDAASLLNTKAPSDPVKHFQYSPYSRGRDNAYLL